MKLIWMAIWATLTASTTFAEEESVAERPVPQIVLHDILTNRVCIFESKLYSIGSKVMILGTEHECANANPMTFGSDDKWDMRWVPTKEKRQTR